MKKLKMIGWEKYNLWVKRFDTMEDVKKYSDENMEQTFVVVDGDIKFQQGIEFKEVK